MPSLYLYICVRILMSSIVDVTSAVTAARNYFQTLKPLLGDSPVENLRLEEVELSEDDKHWLITLGYDTPTMVQSVPAFLSPGSKQPLREYKLFRIDSTTGKVEAMKIRKV